MANKRLYKKSFKTITVLLTLYISCLLIQPGYAEIRSRSSYGGGGGGVGGGGGSSANSVNTNNNSKNKNDGHKLKTQMDNNAADTIATSSTSSAAATASASSSSSSTTSSATTTSSSVNTDFMDKMSWKCANNASCLYSLANGILSSYRRGETVKLGFFDLVKLPTTHKPKSKLNLKSASAATTTTTSSSSGAGETGRSMSSFVDFISGNAIRVPVGPMVFSIQRAEDDDNYIEVALLKKVTSTARLGGGNDDGGGGGGLLGGGGGGGVGGGGGHGGHGFLHRRKEKEDKKQMQMYIPMYLAASTFGWTMVAAKAVGLLTLKALAISKIAFIVAAMVLIKKLMDNASEKQMYQYPEHAPSYMMPYSMDYGMHSMAAAPADMAAAAADMYGGGMPMHPAVGQLAGHAGHLGYEHLAAESMVHQNIAEAQNNTQVMAALNAAGLGQKVKREDSWLGRMAAAAAAEVVVDEDENRQKFKANYFGDLDYDDEEEEDDIFNEEESIKETLQFLATTAARRPMVYNYLNPHSYYRQ